MVYHRGDGRILGAEVAGKAGADKRVDVLSAAIVGGMTVERISALDLAYAPPFSTARDVVNVAGGVAAAARAGLAPTWTAHELAARLGSVAIVDVEPERGRAGRSPTRWSSPWPSCAATSRPAAGPAPRLRGGTERLGYVAARIARLRVKDAGFLTGGLLSWQAAGLPVKQQAPSLASGIASARPRPWFPQRSQPSPRHALPDRARGCRVPRLVPVAAVAVR